MIHVIDVETTGLDPSTDKIVEVAVVGVDFEKRRYRKLFHSLVDPGVPIPPEASAVHHITDAMVSGKAPSRKEIQASLEPFARSTIPCAAHNAGFDRAFLTAAVPGWSAPWICTLRVAKHLWPDIPSYSNQALRYRLKLKVAGDPQPHRAMGDAMTTAALLVREIEMAGDVEKLQGFTNTPVLLRRVPFGKHRGQLWSEVPADYLDWAAGRTWDDPDIEHTIQAAQRGQFRPPPDDPNGNTSA